MLEIILLFLAGIVGGFIAGFMGVGGGIIYIVILPYVFKNENIDHEMLAAVIVANSIFGIFVSSLFSVLTHIRLKTIYISETILISIPALISSLLLLIFYVNTPNYSYQYFNLFIVVLMAMILMIYFFKFNKSDTNKKPSTFKYFISGFISGVVSSLGGVGGAITLIPLLQHWQKIDIKKIKSLSLGMILIMTSGMTIINLLKDVSIQGYVGLINFKIIIPMIIGILISSSLGVQIAHRSKGKYIELTFIIFTTIVLINKLYILIS